MFLAASLALLLAATPRPAFTVTRDAKGIAWIVNPVGKRIWSFGVCVVDTGIGFADYDTKNPGYAAWRFYGSQPAWASGALKTLRSGGFNTVGAWSSYGPLLASPANDLYMTPIIHAGSSAGFPWLDMWDPALVKVADNVTHDLVASLKHDPRIIGYFSDNELGWWKPAVFDWIWKQKTLNTRRHAVAVLKGHYRGSWAGFTKDFEIVGAKSWSQLAKAGRPYLRPDCSGQPAISNVLSMLAERYYSLCRSLVKKYAPEALYLGDRYISNYYPEVAAAAGRYCDVVSTNLNPDFTDGSFVGYYLSNLEALTHKPLMVTEYYMCSKENRSGNANDHSGFPVVQTLAERAAGFKRTTTDLLSNPDVVGAHWFQYYDEPTNGRGDGENYNFGLVDIDNRPYSELLDASKGIDIDASHLAASRLHPVSADLPQEIDPDPLKWDRARAEIASDTSPARGELYACRQPDGIHLALIWPEERFSEGYFKSGKVPVSAITTLAIDSPSAGALLRLGDKAKVLGGDVKVESYAPGQTARLTVVLSSSLFGPLRIALVSEGRAYTTVWRIRGR